MLRSDVLDFSNYHWQAAIFKLPGPELVRHSNKPTFYNRGEINSTCPVYVENLEYCNCIFYLPGPGGRCAG